MKPPSRYALLSRTWSFDRHQRIVDISLSAGFGLWVERSIFGRYYVFGRKF